jgi:glycosyltransferase involved in cell wall biosynthesis
MTIQTNTPKVSLILAFYNRIDYLKLVLAGIERQTFRDLEIIIADDGSAQSIVEEIEKLTSEVNFPLTHLWQEDKGFRKNKMLNKAIVSASTDYLVFIDADCVPHSNFVKEHFKHKEKKVCLTGRRVNLSEKITSRLNQQKILNGFLENNLIMLMEDGIFGKSFDVEKGFYLRNEFLRKYFNEKPRGLLGCNFSIHKSDLLNINGFDERYEAPSIGEDTDIQFRLELTGMKIKSLNNIAVQYHLFHELQKRRQTNIDLFEEIKKSSQSYTPFGIYRQ